MAACVWILLLMFAAIPSFAHAQSPPSITSQEGETLELPTAPLRSQQPAGPLIHADPSNSVLVIPQASRDFIGEWGGKLTLDTVIGGVRPPRHAIVSVGFGEKDGAVFMRTTAFAGPGARIIDTSAQVLTPRRVKLSLEGFDYSHDPPIRHVESLSLALVGKDRMDCIKYVDLYIQGSPDPIAQVDFHGTLRPMTEDERQALEMEVLQKGEVPQANIEGSRRFDQ